jgi:predicted RNA-binding protein YlxR (DUF448 family)
VHLFRFLRFSLYWELLLQLVLLLLARELLSRGAWLLAGDECADLLLQS